MAKEKKKAKPAFKKKEKMKKIKTKEPNAQNGTLVKKENKSVKSKRA